MNTLSQRLDLKLGQNLVMTPQLQQAIKMLQMSTQELTDFVLAEIEQNPLLERADPETGLGESEAEQGNSAELQSREADDARDSAELTSETTLQNNALDTDYDNVWSADAGGSTTTSNFDGDDNNNWLEQVVSEKKSLRDHVLEQIQLDLDDPAERLIALLLLEQLDDAGYCKADVTELASRLNSDEARVAAVLKKLQALDPPGIFARNLSECLAIQLHDQGLLTDEMEALLQHLDLLAEKSFGQLEKICGVSREELGQMMTAIKALNPKPAFGFDSAYAPSIIPDILVRKTAAGEWSVELNHETLPKVLINETYHAKIKDGTHNKQELDYVQERYNAAQWLVKALHQRATTVLKVGTELVKQQENFLNFGLDFLKPITLKDIATAIGMHESTISRVTTAKYMATPKGVYELKYFFSTALGDTAGGMSHTATAVKNRIKTLIEGEDPKQVLSDDQIVAALKAEGIDIARRTVAKYREAMHIGSSTERRRLKANSAK